MKDLCDVGGLSKSRGTILLAGVLCGLVVAAAVSYAVYLAREKVVGDELMRARTLAGDSMEKLNAIIRVLATSTSSLRLPDAVSLDATSCSKQLRAGMQASVLENAAIAGMALVQNNTIRCLSFREDPVSIPVGQAKKFANYEIRDRVQLPVQLPFSGSVPFTIVTEKSTGLSVLLHNGKAGVIPHPSNTGLKIGLINARSGEFLLTNASEALDSEVTKQIRSHPNGWQMESHDSVIAWVGRPSADLIAYASIPSELVSVGWSRHVWFSGVAGLVAGMLASAIGIHLFLRTSSLSSTLRRHIREDASGFHLHYQPIVDLRSGRWIGAEALMRWTLKNGEEISPGIFIRIAERIGLIDGVTNKLMHMFESEAADMLRRTPSLHVALNISPLDFNSEAFPEKIENLLKRMDIDASSLHLEITESTMLTGDHIAQNMKAMRNMGVKVAIDDFGTGYSGLSYLTNFGAQILKIDKSFVETIHPDSPPSHVVDHIISMATSLDMQIVAEGVETQYQLDYLRVRGVQFAQGWYFSKALPFDEFEQQVHLRNASNKPVMAA